MTRALEGLRPAPDDAAEWALSVMRGRTGVALIVPDRFPAVVRIMHQLTETVSAADRDEQEARQEQETQEAQEAQEHEWTEREVRWAEVLPDLLAAQERPGFQDDAFGPYSTRDAVLTRAIAAALRPLLGAATTTPEDAYYGLWRGHGEIDGGRSVAVLYSAPAPSRIAQARERRRLRQQAEAAERPVRALLERCPTVPWWGGRDAYLLRGPLAAIDALGASTPFPEIAPEISDEVEPFGPMWWFPRDHAWFLGNEIDDAWSYLAGSRDLIDGVLALAATGAVEAIEVTFADAW
ncbi:hypothetical protein ACMYYO_06410 [Dermacoccaceae bacterium W4C1]